MSDQWFTLKDRDPSTIYCPICGLPETMDEYEEECQCWPQVEEE